MAVKKGIHTNPTTEFGKGHIPWNKGKHVGNKRLGLRHSKEAKDKISLSRKNRKAWDGESNPNYKGRISTGHKASEKHKEAARQRMLNGGAAKARKANGGIETKIEKIIREHLEKRGIKFEQWRIINHHAVDFFIEPNSIIECDGKYWHSLPIQIERDKKFNKYCEGNNFNLLRLGEDEILNENYVSKTRQIG